MFSRVLAVFLTALLVGLTPVAASAAATDAVLNKEGYWGIDVDNGACAASMGIEGGQILRFRALKGAVTFAVFSTDKRLPKGKVGQLEADGVSFAFAPSYTDDARALYYDGDLNQSALAALRAAEALRLSVDRREVTAVSLKGTGLAGALDGVIACSKGEAGWWGEGVKLAAAEAAPPQDIWEVRSSKDGFCTAMAHGPDDAALIFVAGRQGVVATVGSKALGKHGRKGLFEIDGYSFEFKPNYDGADFLSAGEVDSQTLFLLRRTKELRISVDGREVLNVHVEGSGLDVALDRLAACARGEAGPWSEAAKD
jgi:hypothetical protein